MTRKAQRLPVFRRLKKAGIAAIGRIAPALYRAYMRLVVRSSRVDLTALEELFAQRRKGSVLAYAVLHQDIFVAPYLFKNRRVLTFANVGDAGDVISAILADVGFLVERGGSSSRVSRLVPVLSRLLARCRAERDRHGAVVAFPCDGSKGPPGAVKGGIALFGLRTAAEVYAVKIAASRALYLRTWDRTMIPLPFGRLRALATGPIALPAGNRRDRIEEYRRDIEKALHRLHAQAFRGRVAVPHLVPLSEAPAALRKGRRLARPAAPSGVSDRR